MEKIAIQYRDSSGEITERQISEIEPEGMDAIFAYCHTRDAGRTFKLANILVAADSETGEAIENIWKKFGLAVSPDGRERIESLLANALPAIKALKFFTLMERGFAKRERGHLLQFMKQNFEVSSYSDEEIDEWLQKIWCGDIYAFRDGNTAEYEFLLNAIPSSMKRSCRETALLVAAGSKRRRLEQEAIDRINREFGE